MTGPLQAAAALFQRELSASMRTWTERREQAAIDAAELEEIDMSGTKFVCEFPSGLAERAGVQRWLKETALRAGSGAGAGVQPVVTFLTELAAAAESGDSAQVDVTALDRQARILTRRVLFAAKDRATMDRTEYGRAMPGFALALLGQWEQFIRFTPPAPGVATDRWGEEARAGAVVPRAGAL
jgi:hypothetical protein